MGGWVGRTSPIYKINHPPTHPPKQQVLEKKALIDAPASVTLRLVHLALLQDEEGVEEETVRYVTHPPTHPPTHSTNPIHKYSSAFHPPRSPLPT